MPGLAGADRRHLLSCADPGGTSVASRKQRIVPVNEAVRVRRSYFDCRYGQLHVRTAFPSSGGFDEHTTLLCFHPATAGGRAFHHFLPHIATDRSVYAPDAPGCGESDAAPGVPSIADYAAASVDFIDTMRLRQVDVLGHGVGALVAAELAILKPEQVRRVVLVSIPLGRSTPAAAVPAAGDEAAAQLARYAEAGRQYAASERLPLVRQPTLVLRPKDEHWDSTLHARQYLHGIRLVDLPEVDGRLFDTQPAGVARQTRDFLNAR
jgi:pimeloyl-ACP methyl ester carboxylesterase